MKIASGRICGVFIWTNCVVVMWRITNERAKLPNIAFTHKPVILKWVKSFCQAELDLPHLSLQEYRWTRFFVALICDIFSYILIDSKPYQVILKAHSNLKAFPILDTLIP
jgi:hypothetical protein